jgi:nuclear pore complex protein Nup214
MADINDNERVVKDFFFKQLRKVAVGGLAVPDDARASLLACSSVYGLTFLATSSGVCVFETAVLVSVDTAPTYGSKNTPADLSLLQATHIPTPTVPLYLSLSSDSLTLCVAWRVNGILSLNFYDTKAVVLAKSSPIQSFCSISPTTEPGVGVSGVQWNPGSPELLAVVLSSGALYVLEVKEDVKVVASEVDMGAASLCWSPKGKQLALGVKDGCIVQYSHKTHGVKQRHACPDTFRGVPQQVTGVQWVSTYMFAAVYTPTAGSDHTPTFLFLSTPKNGPAVWSNWGDVYYGGGRRADKYHFIYLSL